MWGFLNSLVTGKQRRRRAALSARVIFTGAR